MGANGTLDNNKQRLFKFSDKASCNQDIKAVFDEGDTEVTWDNLDLCEINKLTLKYDRSTKGSQRDQGIGSRIRRPPRAEAIRAGVNFHARRPCGHRLAV